MELIRLKRRLVTAPRAQTPQGQTRRADEALPAPVRENKSKRERMVSCSPPPKRVRAGAGDPPRERVEQALMPRQTRLEIAVEVVNL
jgi:hypothetical protein